LHAVTETGRKFEYKERARKLEMKGVIKEFLAKIWYSKDYELRYWKLRALTTEFLQKELCVILKNRRKLHWLGRGS
jgi:hypothetical protein